MLCGYSAAELLHAGCGPPSADAEVLIPERDGRRHPGLRVHRGRLFADEVCEVDGIALTTPLFTAWTLARRSSLVEAVVAVDTLATSTASIRATSCAWGTAGSAPAAAEGSPK